MKKRAKFYRAMARSVEASLRSQKCLIESLEQRMLLTTVTPAQWVDSQAAPNMNPANTLPTLSTFHPNVASVSLSKSLADRWGYSLMWADGNLSTAFVTSAMNDPNSTSYQLAMLAKNNPTKYKLGIVLSKEYSPGIRNPTDPAGYAYDADGNSLGAWSPQMPDSVIQQWAMARADGILALESYGIPVNGVVLNSGEYGFGGFDEATAMKDPAVAAARGSLSWLDYQTARAAHYNQIVTDAVRAVTPDRQLLVMYTANPARDRGARWAQSVGDPGAFGIQQFVFPWLSTNTWPMLSLSDVPAGESYYRFGWGSGGYSVTSGGWDMLSMEMNSFAQQQALGHTRSYYWLDGSRTDYIGPVPKYNYMGYLKTLYTAGMLGAVEQSYGQDVGFNPQNPNASFDDATPPRWLQSFTWQSQVYGEFTWLNDFITNSDLLPGPSQQKYSWDLPAYEFPAVSDHDRDVRILVRQAKDGAGGHKNDWLVTAWWASDTATEVTSKEVQVDIPGLGIVSVTARNAGSVYRIRKNTAGEIGIQFLDPNADMPSQNFTASGNVAPVAMAQSTHALTSTAKGIKLIATDDNADLLTYTVLTQPAHGSLSGSGANLTYTPTAGYTGPDSFTFKAGDGTVDSNIATLSLTVNAANAAPVATAGSLTTLINTGKKIQLTGTDANGDILTYSITGNPAHGTLSGINGNLFYTPADNWFGSDSFSFVANDGTVNSSAASVAISIAAPTVLPTATISPGQSTMYKRPGGDNTPQRVFVLSLWGNTVNYPVVVNYTVTGGTAVGGVDYKPLSGRAVFRPGDSNLAIMTNVYDDAGGDKTLSVQLSPSSVYALSTATTTETIYNDEQPTVSISDRRDWSMSGGSDVSVTRGGGSSAFYVQLKDPPTTDRVVYFTVSGSAVEGVDYILPGNANHQVLIKANMLYSQIPILAVDNGLVNGFKSLLITLTPDPGYKVTPDWPGRCYANIYDNPAGAQVAAPYGLVRPGIYDTAQTVSLASRTPGASIRYTLDGSTPSATNGILYAGSFVVSATTYVQAYAYKAGLADSRVIGASYTIVCVNPTISWNSSTQMVSLSVTTPGASIYYTTDYTAPVTDDIYRPGHAVLYTGPFVMSDPTKVRAIAVKSGQDNSHTTGSVTINNQAPPTAPAGLTAVAVSTNGINLSWTDNSSDETGFRIERATNSSFTQNFVTLSVGANVTTYSATGLNGATTYYFRIRATRAGSDSANSNSANATTQTISTLQNTGFEFPVLSGGGNAYVGNPVGASWTFGGSSGIQRNGSAWGAANAPEGSQTAFLQGATSAISQSTTLAAGTYSINFQAARRSGQIQPLKISVDGVQVGSLITPASNNFAAYSSASFTVTAGSHTIMLQGTDSGGDLSSFVDKIALEVVMPLPATPTNLTATPVSLSQINLTWTDNSNNETGFKIERATNSAFTQNLTLLLTTAANATSYSDTGLLPGMTYYYRVRATSGTGDSANCTAASATALTASPTDLAATTGAFSQINLSWSDNSGNETGFKVERATDSGFTQNLTLATTTAANATSYTDTGLLAATTYYYRVRAASGTGDSANSTAASATTRAFAAVQNPGFESPVLSGGSNAYVGNPVGAGWTFSGSSGIQRNGSVWGAASSPEGSQTAFLQNATSAISQILDLAAGTYTVRFQAARRSGQVQPIKISVDGTQIGSLITPASDSFAAYSSATLTVTAGNHTIMLQGTASGDLSSMIDQVNVVQQMGVIYTDAATFTVSNTDLLQTQLASASFAGTIGNGVDGSGSTAKLIDGAFGGNGDYANGVPDACFAYSGASATYTLDTTTNTAGYNLSEIDIYSGWVDGGRNAMNVTVSYATVADPATYVVIGTATYTPTQQGKGAITGFTALGVKSVRFDFGTQQNGYAGYHELDVIGTPAAPAPVAPSGLIATAVSSSQVNLTWTDNSSNETGFKIERATDSGFTQNLTLVTTTAANVASYSNTGLSAGPTYHYRIRATNAVGDSANSNIASVNTAIAGDFNLDSARNAADIDLLFAAIRSGTNPAAYDLTGGGLVNSADTDQLILTLLGTRYGDFNLDHKVNLDDASLQLTNWQSSGLGWAQGDCTGDGRVNLDDASLVLTNWGWVAPAASAAPAAMVPANALLATEAMAEQSVAPLAGDSVNASAVAETAAVAADPVPAGLAGEAGGVVVAVAPVLPVVTVAPVAVTVVPVVRTGEAITWIAPVELAIGTALSGPSSTDRAVSDAGVGGVVTVGGGGNDTVYGDGVGDMLLAWDGRGDVSGGEPTEVGTTTRATTEWLLQGGAGEDTVKELLDLNMQVEGLLG